MCTFCIFSLTLIPFNERLGSIIIRRHYTEFSLICLCYWKIKVDWLVQRLVFSMSGYSLILVLLMVVQCAAWLPPESQVGFLTPIGFLLESWFPSTFQKHSGILKSLNSCVRLCANVCLCGTFICSGFLPFTIQAAHPHQSQPGWSRVNK